jgi:hypothetical protein
MSTNDHYIGPGQHSIIKTGSPFDNFHLWHNYSAVRIKFFASDPTAVAFSQQPEQATVEIHLNREIAKQLAADILKWCRSP